MRNIHHLALALAVSAFGVTQAAQAQQPHRMHGPLITLSSHYIYGGYYHAVSNSPSHIASMLPNPAPVTIPGAPLNVYAWPALVDLVGHPGVAMATLPAEGQTGTIVNDANLCLTGFIFSGVDSGRLGYASWLECAGQPNQSFTHEPGGHLSLTFGDLRRYLGYLPAGDDHIGLFAKPTDQLVSDVLAPLDN